MNIYIDESGSMTNESSHKANHKFIICMVLTENQIKLKKVYKRFVSKHLEELKATDKNDSMFYGNKFSELKGSNFTPILKRKFVEYFCRNEHFRIMYIEVDNRKANINFYKNKARAFNYVLKLALEHLCNINELNNQTWNLQIDERNVKTDSKHHLQDFLLTELSTGKGIVENINVNYFDSSQNALVQIADVFSNLYYSNYMTDGRYNNTIDKMKEEGYLIKVFYYPPDF